MASTVISSQEEREIITHDGNIKKWNQKTFEWINNMFIEYDTKWRWIYEFLGIGFYGDDGTYHEENVSKQSITHREMMAYETSRNAILKNAVDDLQAQLSEMKKHISYLERNMVAHVNDDSIHNSLEDKKDIKF